MPRRPRLVIEGQPHHVVQRGHNRAPVFFAEEDYLCYKEFLHTAATRYGCAIHAYCLMTNHIHLLVTPATKTALSSMMQMLGRLYVRYVNKRKKRSGALWEDRFKISLVDADDYLMACMRYIEMNPVRARMVRKAEKYRWSSHAANAHEDADMLVTPHAHYATLGKTRASRAASYRALFGKGERAGDLAHIRASIQGNWVLGNDNFRDRAARKTRLAPAPARRGGDRRSKAFLRKTGKRKAA